MLLRSSCQHILNEAPGTWALASQRGKRQTPNCVAQSKGAGARPHCKYGFRLSLSVLTRDHVCTCYFPRLNLLCLERMLIPHQDAVISRPKLAFGFQPSEAAAYRLLIGPSPRLQDRNSSLFLSSRHSLLFGSLSTFSQGSRSWVRAYSQPSRTLGGNALWNQLLQIPHFLETFMASYRGSSLDTHLPRPNSTHCTVLGQSLTLTAVSHVEPLLT